MVRSIGRHGALDLHRWCAARTSPRARWPTFGGNICADGGVLLQCNFVGLRRCCRQGCKKCAKAWQRPKGLHQPSPLTGPDVLTGRRCRGRGARSRRSRSGAVCRVRDSGSQVQVSAMLRANVLAAVREAPQGRDEVQVRGPRASCISRERASDAHVCVRKTPRRKRGGVDGPLVRGRCAVCCMRARLCSALCARPDRRQFRSGVRNKAEYRSLTEFTDNDLRSDFHFLSDVERVADTAHREAYKAKLMLRPELPNHLRNLVRQAAFRSVALQIMPATLQRRKQNTTFFNHKSKEMHWRVEFVFHMDGAAVHAHDKVPDATPLRELLGKHLDPDLGIKMPSAGIYCLPRPRRGWMPCRF